MGHNNRFPKPNSLRRIEDSSYNSIMFPRNNAFRESVLEIASFIRYIGDINSWDEAELYSEKFRNNDLGKKEMETLTDQLLESDLGITNSDHRAEIISAIRSRFPAEILTNIDITCSITGI